MDKETNQIAMCYHCGNRVPLRHIATHEGRELFEHIDGERYAEDYEYLVYSCPTCAGLSLFGDFKAFPRHRAVDDRRLYPVGSRLLPDAHKIASQNCVPERITQLYYEIWPLRHIAPNAFAGQIRRALEFICQEQGAVGSRLHDQLKDLASKGTFPGYFADMTDLMRHIGNLGAHAAESDIDFWDAELLDDFFRSVVEYVYIAPSRIERMRQRTGTARPANQASAADATRRSAPGGAADPQGR